MLFQKVNRLLGDSVGQVPLLVDDSVVGLQLMAEALLVFIFTASIIAENTQLAEVSVCWGSLGSVLRKE